MNMSIRRKWILECCVCCCEYIFVRDGCFRCSFDELRSISDGSIHEKYVHTRKWTNIWDNNNNNCSANNNINGTQNGSANNNNNNKIIISKNELYIYSEWLQISLYFSLTCFAFSMLSPYTCGERSYIRTPYRAI